MKHKINLLREFSIPLICGVLAALAWVNLSPETYTSTVYSPILFGQNLHFFTNEIFMVFFFAIAAVEITTSCLPGGDLNPPKKAMNPLFGTLGGVLVPALTFVLLNRLFGSKEVAVGWGIPTATDIALAWLVGRMVFGRNHPVIAYLLLLAICDDAIGLVIIAVFYPNPLHPVVPAWLLLTLVGMTAAYLLSRSKVKNYWYYLVLGGVPSWLGLFMAHLHPALALVFIVPFFPHPRREHLHLFEFDTHEHSTLSHFESDWKITVDFGLFLFGLANAGVQFAEVGKVTWFVAAALIVGKPLGIFAFGMLATFFGFPLPEGVNKRSLLVMGMIAGIGFTVAIFVAGEAFTDAALKGQAKMGAMLSICAMFVAYGTGKLLGIRKV